MSQKIDPREVLAYLNELGYTNINAQQLKEFITGRPLPLLLSSIFNDYRDYYLPMITDLKKLIKYEYKHTKKNVENISPTSSYLNYNGNNESRCCNEPFCPNNQPTAINEGENDDNVFNYLYNQPTISSRAKEIPKRERHISVHITKARNRNEIHDHCIHIEKEVKDDRSQHEHDIQLVTDIGSTISGSQLVVETESTIKSIRPCSKQSLICKSSSSKVGKSKSVLIRPTYTKPINRCDPVALYHHYQEEWKKQKFPGQENHSDLRWAVREKLLRGPKVDYPRTTSSCRSRSNSWKI
ncbi:hypothetical protein NQ314_010131 [Rhamnusium bicolor]|uniref:Centriolar and ciliogenesis-associated protein HYLS1 C-terminal domain-containing protein n=1 Tax=Rhamnusium bicolor TaxID=1586634 RepID=A0AAV8XTP2_9CUCU|nr:hypothetical protein NQ314_010131 [Rhamnusium bicolor]